MPAKQQPPWLVEGFMGVRRRTHADEVQPCTYDSAPVQPASTADLADIHTLGSEPRTERPLPPRRVPKPAQRRVA